MVFLGNTQSPGPKNMKRTISDNNLGNVQEIQETSKDPRSGKIFCPNESSGRVLVIDG